MTPFLSCPSGPALLLAWPAHGIGSAHGKHLVPWKLPAAALRKGTDQASTSADPENAPHNKRPTVVAGKRELNDEVVNF